MVVLQLEEGAEQREQQPQAHGGAQREHGGVARARMLARQPPVGGEQQRPHHGKAEQRVERLQHLCIAGADEVVLRQKAQRGLCQRGQPHQQEQHRQDDQRQHPRHHQIALGLVGENDAERTVHRVDQPARRQHQGGEADAAGGELGLARNEAERGEAFQLQLVVERGHQDGGRHRIFGDVAQQLQGVAQQQQQRGGGQQEIERRRRGVVLQAVLLEQARVV